MLIAIIALVSLAWLLVVATVLGACRMAARGDAALLGEGAPTQSPRRPSTCGTVRSRILMSVHSDQLATYR